MPRGSSVSELKKKRKNLFARPDSAIGRTKNTNQGKTEEKKSSGKKGGPTKAQKMAKANIKKYGGTASAAKANKAAMKLKIKKAYMAKKKKK